MQKDFRKRLTESIEDYGNLCQIENPLNKAMRERFPALHKSALKAFQTAGDPELEQVRQKLRRVFEDIQNDSSIVIFPTTQSAAFSSDHYTALVFHRRPRRTLYLSSSWFELVMQNAALLLEEFGLDVIRRCPQCGMYFVGFRRHKFCTRRCTEAAKRSRPERQEYQARLMFKRGWSKSHKGQEPSEKKIAEWRKEYQRKRRNRQS